MSADREVTRIVRSWLKTEEHESANRVLATVLDSLDATPQRRPMWQAWRERFMNGTFRLAAAGLATVIVAAVGLAVYFSGPAVGPAASPSPLAPPSPLSASPSPLASPLATNETSPPSPTAEPVASFQPTESSSTDRVLVAYTRTESLPSGHPDCTQFACSVSRIWLANADGSDERPLHPFSLEGEDLIGWLPDGSGILYTAQSGLFVADPDGTVEQTWDYTVLGDHAGAFAVSPDGVRLAFVRRVAGSTSVIAILDLASGTVTELASTRTEQDPERCVGNAPCEGSDAYPRWSPDETRLSFHRQAIGGGSAVLTVNVDGSDLRRITPDELYALDASWSPDESRLVFTVAEPNGDSDIYTARTDGSDIQRLTSDGFSGEPEWTDDGRVTFARFQPVGDVARRNWIMDADGANQTLLGDSLGELTAAGCRVCNYPPFTRENPEGDHYAYWQPVR